MATRNAAGGAAAVSVAVTPSPNLGSLQYLYPNKGCFQAERKAAARRTPR